LKKYATGGHEDNRITKDTTSKQVAEGSRKAGEEKEAEDGRLRKGQV